jgi:hypothetical protein
VSVGGEEVRSDPDGNYEIALVPAGDAEVRLRIGKAAIERPRMRVPESGEVRLDFDLKGVTVRGRLVGEGDYVRNVTLWRPGKGPFGGAEVGADGAFAIPFVEPGEYEIWGATISLQGARRKIVVGSEDLDIGELTMDPGSEVPVLVTAPAGISLAGTYSAWAYPPGWTYPSDNGKQRLVQISLDEGGRGVVRLPAGRWRVTFGLGGLQQAEVTFDVPAAAPVRFDLKR